MKITLVGHDTRLSMESWVFVAVLGLSLVAVSGSCSPVAVNGLLTEGASPVAELRP